MSPLSAVLPVLLWKFQGFFFPNRDINCLAWLGSRTPTAHRQLWMIWSSRLIWILQSCSVVPELSFFACLIFLTYISNRWCFTKVHTAVNTGLPNIDPVLQISSIPFSNPLCGVYSSTQDLTQALHFPPPFLAFSAQMSLHLNSANWWLPTIFALLQEQATVCLHTGFAGLSF